MKMSQISHAPVSFASKSHVAFFGSKKMLPQIFLEKTAGLRTQAPIN